MTTQRLLTIKKSIHVASVFVATAAVASYLFLVMGSVFVGAETRAFEAKEQELLGLITEHEEEYLAVLQTITKEVALSRGFIAESPVYFVEVSTPSVALQYE